MNVAERVSESLREGLIALVVAVCVTGVVYAAGGGRFGADLSQQIIAALERSPLRTVEWRPKADDPRFLLLDAELQSCAGQSAPCTPTDPLKGARLAALLERVRHQQPRLVVVDALVAGGAAWRSGAVPTPPGAAGERPTAATAQVDPALRHELDRDGPPVLIAWTSDPSRQDSEHRALHVDRADSVLLRPGSFGHARFLPAFISGGPTSRYLVPSVCLTDETNDTLVTPTLAYGAALLLQRGGRIDGLSGYPLPARSRGADPSLPCDSLPGDSRSKGFADTERVFSAGSIRPEGEARSERRDRGVSWSHRKYDPAGGEVLPPMQGAVVVIGTADPDARDNHWSVLGELSGSEIIMNDVRQFLVAEPAPASNWAEKMWDKWPFFLVGFLAWVAGELLGLLVLPVKCGLIIGLLRRPVRFLLPPLTTLIAFALLLSIVPHLLHSPPDFVTPFLALLSEAVVELLFKLIFWLRNALRLGTKKASA